MDMKGDKFGYLRKSGAIGVATKAISVSGSTRGKGSLGSASVETKGLAKRANIEGNESAMYERLEKKSLKGLKGGGTEKELRDGHNTRGGMKLESPGMKTPKMKPAYDFNTNPIKAAKQENRSAIKAAKMSDVPGAVKTAKALGKDEMRVAKGVRQARNAMGLRKEDKMAGKMARKTARNANMNRGLASLV